MKRFLKGVGISIGLSLAGALHASEFSHLETVENSPAELTAAIKKGEARSRTEQEMADIAKLISRHQVVRQAAFSYGAQAGLAWRHEQLVQLVESDSALMTKVFNFSPFLVDGKLLMPVVAKTQRVYEQQSSKQARTVGVSYTLRRPARLVPAAPNWRDFMTLHVDEPVEPDQALFPRDSEESAIWAEAVRDGWSSGVEQAEEIFQYDIRTLTREIQGMYMFRELVAQGIVTMPAVSASEYAVLRLDDGKTLHVKDVITVISEESSFTDSEKWEPVVMIGGS